MARLMAWLRRRLVPSTLFGRLTVLLFVTAAVSHLLALKLMFELGPQIFGPGPAPATDEGAYGPMDPLFYGALPPEPPPPGPPSLLYPGLWLDVLVRLAPLMLAAWIGARWLSHPIQRLARAAREIGKDIRRPPLAEEGTDECCEATRVFNQMQAQICHQLDERDCLVAAVSHDLRTPLTRLALRIENVSSDALRQDLRRDIGEMETMLTTTLDYLRGMVDPEPLVPLDLTSLLSSMADDRMTSGQCVRLLDTGTRAPCAPLLTQASSLRRCLDNLIDNAVRYGGSADIRYADGADHIHIEIIDAGPGIAEAELDNVLLPFYRVEASRNRHSGGVGLGLAVASTIVRRLGGQLVLKNGTPAGLVARVTLPR